MARTTTTTITDIERLLEEYAKRTQTRREFCEQHGIAEHTLHYYQRRLREQQDHASSLTRARVREPRTRLARVQVAAATAAHESQRGQAVVAVVLANGRRVELAQWAYRDEELARLIRMVEEA